MTWLHRAIRLVIPSPDHAPWPRRTDAPWCERCGMTLPAHWDGCKEKRGEP